MSSARLVAAAIVSGSALLIQADGYEPEVAHSSSVALDTRSVSAVVPVEGESLDTRSFTADRSEARRLNTKKIVGTAMLIR